MKRKATGLSLVETIVVVAIILIVLAILIPVFSSAKGVAKRASCGSNMRQLGLALTMYATDHDQLLPPHPNYEALLQNMEPGMYGKVPTGSGSPNRLVNSMAAYVKSNDVWFCPTDPVKARNVLHRGIDHEYTSYHYLVTLNYDNYRWPVRVNLDLLPAHFALLADATGDWSDYDSDLDFEDQSEHTAETANFIYPDLSIHLWRKDSSVLLDWG